MNILLIGTPSEELCAQLRKSSYLDKLYTASSIALQTVANVEYTDFEDLVKKCLALQIDVVIVLDKSFVKEGLVETFKKYRLNIISVNSKWFNLETSKLVAKKLTGFYSFNLPQVLKAPLAFPIVVKADNSMRCKLAYSMQNLVEIVSGFNGEEYFLEEYLEGEVYEVLTLWDGKSLWMSPYSNNFTEVQTDRLDLYKTKLSFMLSDEQADFMGFFVSKLIWAKNDWYLLEFYMGLKEKFVLENPQVDFLRLIYMAIYQKLNEI